MLLHYPSEEDKALLYFCQKPVERQPARVAHVAVGDGEVVVRNELEVVVVKKDRGAERDAMCGHAPIVQNAITCARPKLHLFVDRETIEAVHISTPVELLGLRIRREQDLGLDIPLIRPVQDRKIERMRMRRRLHKRAHRIVRRRDQVIVR